PTFDPDGGADGASRLSLAGGATNLDQDFGYRGTAGVGDLLWLDVDADGTQTGNEPGLAGVVVTVRSSGADGIQGTPDDIVVVTTTDSSGRYRALGLPAGDVVVSYDPTTLPAGYVPASDLDGGSASSAVATLSSGGTRLDVDFVVVGNAALNGVVFDDVNGNGVRDPGDRGISGARVVVIWNGPVGPVTIIVTTDATGAWSKSTLPPGTYTATIDLASVPQGYRPSTGTTSTVNLPAGGVRSFVQGLTTLSLALTGLATVGVLYLAGSLLAAGLLVIAGVYVRRRRGVVVQR
uniref:SdrD B-like domain-containing protein n=1 Tax=Salinibacterium sp. TaxID=1915057 RepID=UPI00286AE106